MYSVHIFTESTWVCSVKCHSGYASALHPLPPAHWSSAQQHLVYMEQLARRKKYMEPNSSEQHLVYMEQWHSLCSVAEKHQWDTISNMKMPLNLTPNDGFIRINYDVRSSYRPNPERKIHILSRETLNMASCEKILFAWWKWALEACTLKKNWWRIGHFHEGVFFLYGVYYQKLQTFNQNRESSRKKEGGKKQKIPTCWLLRVSCCRCRCKCTLPEM